MKIKEFYEPVFRTHLLCLYNCNPVEAENYLNSKDIKAALRKCTGQTGSYFVTDKDRATQTRYYIYLEKQKPEKLLFTLSHEISHLVFMSLFDCGIKITQETDETFSYYQEWWLKEVYKEIVGKK